MQHFSTRWLRLVSVILLLAFVLQAPLPASAGDSIPELLGPGAALAADATGPLTLRARSATLEAGLLEPVRAALAAGQTPGPLALSLFEDARLLARFHRLDPAAGGYTLAGSLDGYPMGEIHLSLSGESAFASINTGSALFRVSAEGRAARVVQVDTSKFPPEAEPLTPPAPAPVTATASPRAVEVEPFSPVAASTPAVLSAREAGLKPIYLYYDPDPLPVRVEPRFTFDALSPQSATFTIHYLAAGQQNAYGYTCQAFPPSAQTAFTAAANVWASLVTSPVPITIEACWTDMASGILGGSASLNYVRNFTNAPYTATWYPISQANALYGSDIDPASNCTGSGYPTTWCDDMTIMYNSDYAGSYYYGTDGNPGPSQLDFMSIVMHEIAHGLGFSGGMDVNAGSGYYGVVSVCDYPNSYDRFTYSSTGTALLNSGTYPCNSLALGLALTSDSVTFRGENAVAANGGGNVPLHTPLTWQYGSSYSHLASSYDGTPNALMTVSLGDGESIHDPGPVGLGVLKDTGWVPFRPTGLTATAVSSSQINLSWTDTNLNETGYKIERSPNGSSGWATVTTTAANATSYNDTSLSANTPYYYRVSAVHALGASLFATANATTLGLNPPGSLTATPVSSSQINLSWTDTNTNESGYRIERSPNGSSGWTLIHTTAANATSYADTGLSPSTPYYYRVRAFNAQGESPNATANATTLASSPPNPPGNLAAVPVSNTQINLTWTDTNSDEIGYQVERSENGYSGWTTLGTTAANATSYASTGLSSGTRYHYQVKAVKSGGSSAYVDTSAITFPLGPGTTDDGTRIDVFVGYTAAARSAAGGTTAILNMINTAVSETNTGYANSKIHQRVTLAGTSEYAYTEGTGEAGWITMLDHWTGTNDGYMDAAHTSRDNLKADEMVLVVADTTYCGLGWLMGSDEIDPSNADEGFVLVSIDCLTGLYTFAHEMGHNMGAHHDRYTVGSNPVTFPFGYGFWIWNSSTSRYDRRTVMAYDTYSAYGYSATRVNYWSNPNVLYESQPAGKPVTDAASAYNALVLNNTAWAVGRYREGNAPTAPSGLAANRLSSSSIQLSWTDASSDESRFLVERASPAAEDWVAIAATAPGATTYTDNAAPAMTVRYRVLSDNGNGRSVSNTAVVFDVPALSGSARRTSVTLLWPDVYGESSYTVQLWNGASWTDLAAGLPAGTTSYQHTGLTPNTTYQYQLKANYTSPSGTTTSNTVVIKTMLYERYLPTVRK